MSAAVLRGVSLVLLTAALACVAVLHVVSPLEPTSQRLSEYANGPYGYLMTTAFAVVGAGLLALGAAIHRHRAGWWRPRFAPAAMAVAGAGMVLSGIFPTDSDPADWMREMIHSQASAIASVALISAAVAWAMLGRRRLSGSWRPSPTAALFALAAAVLGVMSPWLHRSAWTGLSQRALWVALLGWLFLVAWSLRAADDRSTIADDGHVEAEPDVRVLRADLGDW